MRRMRSIMGSLTANTAGFAALQAQTGGTAMTLAATTLPNPTAGQLHNSAAPVTLTSAGVATGNFTVVGYDRHGQLQTEIIVGPNANTVSGHLLFTKLVSITPATTNATTVSAGWAGNNYGPWLVTAWHSAGAFAVPIGTAPTYLLQVTDFNLLDATFFLPQGQGGTPVNDLNSGNGNFTPTDAPYIDIPNTPWPLVPAALQAACPQLLSTNQVLPEEDGTYTNAVNAPSTFTADAVGGAAAAIARVRLDPVVTFAWRLVITNATAGLIELDVTPQRRAY